MATVLEEFLVLFKTDAKDSKKYVDAIGDSFVSVAKKATGLIVSLLSVQHILSEVFEMSRVNDDLGDFSESLGVNAGDVAAWGDALVHYGGNLETFKSTLSGLADSFAMVATTGKSRAKPFFDELGISMVDTHGKARDVMDVLPELAAAAEKMGKQESKGMFSKMGIDEKTIMLLQRGRREVEAGLKQQKQLGEVTDHDTEVASKFNDEMDDMHHMFRSIYTAIGTAILPAFTWVLEHIKKVYLFLHEHQSFVWGFFAGLAGILLYVYGPAVLGAARATTMLIARIALLALPIILVAALIGLLAEDIYQWVTGGKSLIGDLLGSFDEFNEKVYEVLMQIKEYWSGVWDDMTATIDEFFAKLFGYYDKAKGYWDKFNNGIASLTGNLDADTGASSTPINRMKDIGDQANTAFGAASNTPLNSMNSNSISNKNQVTKTNTVTVGKVEINTQATDADGISKAIGGSLNDHLRNAQDQFDDGVKA